MKRVITLGIILLALHMVHAADVNDIIKKVQKKYDKMSNLSAEFHQIDIFKLTGSQNETVGKIFVKDGSRYRFESEDQVIVSDGQTVWTYNNISKQLIIDRVRENSGALLPRDLLFKYPKTHKATLLNEERWQGKKVYIIKLEPKENNQGFLRSIKLTILDKEWTIAAIETVDLNGNTSKFLVKNLDTKRDLPDRLFTYQPGPDTEIVDMR